MINGDHNKQDFDFVVDGEYLVDGILPSLSGFLLSESDPHIEIDFGFASNQEAYQKDIERVFEVLKLIFSTSSN
jgi:hypothetical protein